MDANFIRHVDKNGPVPELHPELGPCWEWTGYRDKRLGYGQFTKWHPELGKRKSYKAHRYAYQQIIGPIPQGADLDHLCRNRGCVNPAHLDPVSHKENVMRGKSFAVTMAAKTYCKNGHELLPAPWNPKRRCCLTCMYEGARMRYRKKKEG